MVIETVAKIRGMKSWKIIRKAIPKPLLLASYEVLRKIFYQMKVRECVDDDTIMLADYPRCGIGWFRFVIATVLHYQRRGDFHKLTHSEMYDYAPTLAAKGKHKPFYFNTTFSLLKTHHNHLSAFKRGVVVYRNPFEAIRSYYTHKTMDEGEIICKDISGLSKEECFLLQEAKNYIDFHKSWLSQIILHPNYYCVIKYEELLQNPAKLFAKVFDFLKIDITNLPDKGMEELAVMYRRRDVSIPTLEGKDTEGAFRAKFDIFKRIEAVVSKDTLCKLNQNLAKEIRVIVEKMDSVRCRVEN